MATVTFEPTDPTQITLRPRRFTVDLGTQGPQGPQGPAGAAIATGRTKAAMLALPSPTAGDLVRVTDAERGLWMYTGAQWIRTAGPVQADVDEWIPKRAWATNFASSAADALVGYEATNLTWTTISGRSCVQQTNAASWSTFFLPAGLDLGNVEVTLKYRIATRSPYALTDQYIRVHGRWLDVDNRMGAWDAYNGFLLLESRSLGTDAFGTTPPGYIAAPINQTDTTKIRVLKFRAIGDALACKVFFEDAAEPDWQVVQRSRPPAAPAGVPKGATASLDNPEHGRCGFECIFTGASFVEFSVVELVHNNGNLLSNPKAALRDTSDSCPAYWGRNKTPAGGEAIQVVSGTDRFGLTRPLFQVVGTGRTVAPLWEQYGFFDMGADAIWTRVNRHPVVPKPGRTVEISVWSKGTDVANPSPSVLNLGAAWVVYYYDRLGNFLQGTVTPADNFGTLGPNPGGVGTWDWHETRARVSIGGTDADWAAATWWRWSFGLHDPSSVTGTVLFSEPVVRSV